METILQDARYAVRLLWQRPGFSVVAILTLALGIGLSTTLFSVIDAVVLHPLPYAHPERLVQMLVGLPQQPGRESNVSINDLRVISASTRVFSDVAAWRGFFQLPIAIGRDPERVRGYEINEGYLPLYGVVPVIGRGIEEEDTRYGTPVVVVLGYDYWQSRFSGKRDILGRTMRFDDEQATIVGVLPAGFHRNADIWRPLRIPPRMLSGRGIGTWTVGRLRPDMSVGQAERELTAVLAHMPRSRAGEAVILRSLVDSASARSRTSIYILVGAVGLILLIACVNVAGQSSSSESEMAQSGSTRTSSYPSNEPFCWAYLGHWDSSSP